MPSAVKHRNVRSALRRVRDFYDLGCKSLKLCPGRMSYGMMSEEASNFGVSKELLRKARQFADPEKGYSLKELTSLFRQCRANGFPLGTTTIIRWLSIPKRRRPQFERWTIAEKWTNSRLDAEIAQEFGSRKAGGRRRDIPVDPLGVLVQLERLSAQWTRWRDSLTRKAEDGEIKMTDRDLPASVRRRLSAVAQEVAGLQAAVAAAIRRQKPNRSKPTATE